MEKGHGVLGVDLRVNPNLNDNHNWLEQVVLDLSDKENVSREIDNAGSESEIDSLEDNINKISLKFPDWEIDFVEDLEC